MSTAILTRQKLTPPQIAKLWGIDQNKVLAWIRSGELRAINGAKVAGGRVRYLVDVADLEAFERSRSTVPDPKPQSARGRRAHAARQTNVTKFF